jgi:hypothetical protein
VLKLAFILFVKEEKNMSDGLLDVTNIPPRGGGDMLW